MKFTPKQRKFIEFYNGNASEAARLAGYSGSDNTLRVTAHHLIRNPNIQRAIRDRENRAINKGVMTRQERQEFWTTIALDKEKELKDRIRASELLAKSEGDFLERLELSTDEGLAELIRAGRERANGKKQG
jgi:phage terminase small subunit